MNNISSLFNTEGVTGFSLKTFKDNWDSDYQKTNNAGIPDPNGKVPWDFKYVMASLFQNLVVCPDFNKYVNVGILYIPLYNIILMTDSIDLNFFFKGDFLILFGL